MNMESNNNNSPPQSKFKKMAKFKLPWNGTELYLFIYAVSTFVDTSSDEPTNSPCSEYDQGLPILHQNFEVIAIIGEGSFGKVIKAKHKHDGKIYAIKCIPLAGVDEDTINEKRQEAIHLSSLKHKNVVSYNFSWIDSMKEIPLPDENMYINNNICRQWFCIQMEYCDTTLAKFIRTSLFRERNNKLDYFFQIVEGLGYVHSKGLVHADLCSDNILVDSEGCVKIADFGLSLCNSPVNDNPYCETGDMKDLGVILNEMFQGALLRTGGPVECSSDELANAFRIFRWIRKPANERPSCAALLTFKKK